MYMSTFYAFLRLITWKKKVHNDKVNAVVYKKCSVIIILFTAWANVVHSFQLKLYCTVKHIDLAPIRFLTALHTGAGRVRAGPPCGIRMRETVHTGAGLGAESREHCFGLFSYVFWVRRWRNEQRNLDLLKIGLSHQISCKHHSRSI